jgi:hypothetical protein
MFVQLFLTFPRRTTLANACGGATRVGDARRRGRGGVRARAARPHVHGAVRAEPAAAPDGVRRLLWRVRRPDAALPDHSPLSDSFLRN